MHQFARLLAVLLVAGTLGLASYMMSLPSAAPAAQAVSGAPTAVASRAAPAKPAGQLVVEARVMPARSAELSFSVGGLPVAEVLVREGDAVAQGDPLVRLDTRDLRLEVEEARAQLARARAEYDKLREWTPHADLTAARAQLDEALTRLRQLQARVTPQDVQAAEARLTAAQARLAQLREGPLPAEVERAQAKLAGARAGLERQRASLAAAKEQARRLVEERADDLRRAQLEYSGAEGDALERAALALEAAESALERARVEYEAARQDEIAGLAIAEAQVAAAEADLALLRSGATPNTLALAEAQIAEAQAELERLRGEEGGGELDEVAAAVSFAQERLAELGGNPSTATVAGLQAAIDQSEVQLRQAELALERATLVAPLDGIVAAVEVAPGETTSAGKPVLVLADHSSWQLETQSVDDLSVVQLREGAPARISFYAIPDLVLTGTVARIKPLGAGVQSQALYTVTITPDRWDERLRWNMPAQVLIGPTE
jgi:HlyD family secretion protein